MTNPTLTPVDGWNKDCWITLLPPNLLAVLTVLARYDVLAKWWADVVKPTRTRLYISVSPSIKWVNLQKIEPDWMINGGVPELKKQLDLNDADT